MDMLASIKSSFKQAGSSLADAHVEPRVHKHAQAELLELREQIITTIPNFLKERLIQTGNDQSTGVSNHGKMRRMAFELVQSWLSGNGAQGNRGLSDHLGKFQDLMKSSWRPLVENCTTRLDDVTTALAMQEFKRALHLQVDQVQNTQVQSSVDPQALETTRSQLPQDLWPALPASGSRDATQEERALGSAGWRTQMITLARAHIRQALEPLVPLFVISIPGVLQSTLSNLLQEQQGGESSRELGGEQYHADRGFFSDVTSGIANHFAGASWQHMQGGLVNEIVDMVWTADNGRVRDVCARGLVDSLMCFENRILEHLDHAMQGLPSLLADVKFHK